MLRLIDLAQENRKLTIRSACSRRSLIITRISARAWFEHYYEKIFTILRHGPVDAAGVEFAALNLLQEVAIGAEGYPRLAGMADWFSKIPIEDKSVYGDALLQVFENKELSGPTVPTLGQACVIGMEALWDTLPSGRMCFHKHLVHQFERPSKQQRERYRDASARVGRTAGVMRRGVPVSLAPEQSIVARALAALYDELILRVDGYAVNGEPLTDDREKIAANMDTFHKVRASMWLFSRGMSETEGRRAA
jgi:hypothetical protein